MIEHPETVADRIERWARAAGRENVIFGNDCGFQSTAGNTEIPITIAWAKLKALGRRSADRLAALVVVTVVAAAAWTREPVRPTMK